MASIGFIVIAKIKKLKIGFFFWNWGPKNLKIKKCQKPKFDLRTFRMAKFDRILPVYTFLLHTKVVANAQSTFWEKWKIQFGRLKKVPKSGKS